MTITAELREHVRRRANFACQHLPETRDTRAQAVDLRVALQSALRPFGDDGLVLAHLREAEILAAALDDPHRLGQVSRFLSLHYFLSMAMMFRLSQAAAVLAQVDAH